MWFHTHRPPQRATNGGRWRRATAGPARDGSSTWGAGPLRGRAVSRPAAGPGRSTSGLPPSAVEVEGPPGAPCRVGSQASSRPGWLWALPRSPRRLGQKRPVPCGGGLGRGSTRWPSGPSRATSPARGVGRPPPGPGRSPRSLAPDGQACAGRLVPDTDVGVAGRSRAGSDGEPGGSGRPRPAAGGRNRARRRGSGRSPARSGTGEGRPARAHPPGEGNQWSRQRNR